MKWGPKWGILILLDNEPQGYRKVLKSWVALSNVVGIICPSSPCYAIFSVVVVVGLILLLFFTLPMAMLWIENGAKKLLDE
jgi:hypothetical protein